MDKEFVNPPIIPNSKGLVIPLSLILIVRACFTILVAYVTKDNASQGIMEPSEAILNYYYGAMTLGALTAVFAVLFWREPSLLTLGILTLTLVIGLVCQIWVMTVEVFYPLTTVIIFPLVAILWYRFIKFSKTKA